MNDDISDILKRWPLGETNVRRIVGQDGYERVQIRVCINTFHGILQFECDGRPDGLTPHGYPFALDYYEDQQRAQGDAFVLSHEMAEELFEESSMTYHRYVLLLQMGDFRRVIRDTERNMRLFRFVNRYAELQEDRMALEKSWPYILRIHGTELALECIQNQDFAGAARATSEARARIEQLEPVDDDTFRHEYERSMEALDDLAKSIEKQRPLSQVERLERLRDEAIAQENYELAARIRDRIRTLREQDSSRDK